MSQLEGLPTDRAVVVLGFFPARADREGPALIFPDAVVILSDPAVNGNPSVKVAVGDGLQVGAQLLVAGLILIGLPSADAVKAVAKLPEYLALRKGGPT